MSVILPILGHSYCPLRQYPPTPSGGKREKLQKVNDCLVSATQAFLGLCSCPTALCRVDPFAPRLKPKRKEYPRSMAELKSGRASRDWPRPTTTGRRPDAAIASLICGGNSIPEPRCPPRPLPISRMRRPHVIVIQLVCARNPSAGGWWTHRSLVFPSSAGWSPALLTTSDVLSPPQRPSSGVH